MISKEEVRELLKSTETYRIEQHDRTAGGREAEKGR